MLCQRLLWLIGRGERGLRSYVIGIRHVAFLAQLNLRKALPPLNNLQKK